MKRLKGSVLSAGSVHVCASVLCVLCVFSGLLSAIRRRSVSPFLQGAGSGQTRRSALCFCRSDGLTGPRVCRPSVRQSARPYVAPRERSHPVHYGPFSAARPVELRRMPGFVQMHAFAYFPALDLTARAASAQEDARAPRLIFFELLFLLLLLIYTVVFFCCAAPLPSWSWQGRGGWGGGEKTLRFMLFSDQ